jgi:type IV pilus secretin PilQ/predicted competence protein
MANPQCAFAAAGEHPMNKLAQHKCMSLVTGVLVWGCWIGLPCHGQEVKPSYSGAPMSMNFQNIEVRAALQVVADFTGLNIITSDSVTGTLTLRLHKVPWDQVLDIMAQAKGLSVRRQGNVIWVAPRLEVTAREKLEYETKLAAQNLEPMQTRGFTLNYAKAVDVLTQIQGGTVLPAMPPAGSRILSPRGSAMAEPRTNQLFVTDVAERIDQVAQMIAKIDIPLRQVMIEARIVQASDTFGQTLGVRLGGLGQGGAQTVWGPTNVNALANANPTAQQATNFNTANKALDTTGSFVNLPASSLNGFASASFAVSIFNADKNRFLNLELSALEADGKGKVVSSPRVVTADQAKALIEQGTELPYQVAAASGATTLAFRKANLKLEVTPQITPEGGIVLDLDVSKDNVGQTTPAGFAIDTKHVKTQVLVENGGTVMIGGIYETSEQEDTYKVPFFGDLPLLGYLFKNRRQAQTKQELLVFITPKMLDHSAVAR